MLSTHDRSAVRRYASAEELLRTVDRREPLRTADALSGSRLESGFRDGVAVVVKHITLDDDWIMRATGDIDCRLLRLIDSGILERLPQTIDHTMVAAAPDRSIAGHRGAVLAMHDVSALLVPPGDGTVALAMHERFIDHMAALHAAFFGWRDDIGLCPAAHHYTILTPQMAALEIERGGADAVPPAVARGWRELGGVHHPAVALLQRLAWDPGPLVAAVAATPGTFVHGDWKFGNMGEHADGTTVLLDWDRCGEGPPTYDLAWYLAVNCDRLPSSKEETVELYRTRLEHHGVAPGAWFEAQLALTLLGAALQLSWSKCGDAAELHWWLDRAMEGAAALRLS